MINPHYFSAIDSEEKAYWLGFFCADGHIYKSLKQISILLSGRDKEHLAKFAAIFLRPLEVSSYEDQRTHKTYESVRLVLSSKGMCSDLLAKGIPQQKTEGLDGSVFGHIPMDVLHHFVRGYFDGDGCISEINIAEYRVTICGTRTFLLSLRHLLPVTSTVNSRPGISVLQFAGTERVNVFMNWIYNDATVMLERKKQTFDRVPKQRGSSKFKGVYYIKARSHWIARVYENHKMHTLGQFKTEEEAYACRIHYETLKLDGATPTVMSDFAVA